MQDWNGLSYVTSIGYGIHFVGSLFVVLSACFRVESQTWYPAVRFNLDSFIEFNLSSGLPVNPGKWLSLGKMHWHRILHTYIKQACEERICVDARLWYTGTVHIAESHFLLESEYIHSFTQGTRTGNEYSLI